MKVKNPVVAIILDGFGINEHTEGNPTKVANMPFWKKLLKEYPHTQIQASEEYVGLPKGQMGGSEVGHLNLGSGRRILQDFMRINDAIEKKTLESNPVIVESFSRAAKNGTALHLIGMVSDGGIHSSYSHLVALLEIAKKLGVVQVYVHAITDGRDSAPDVGREFLERLQRDMDTLQLGKIATVCGRFYAMDREERWSRTEKAFNLIAFGQGEKVEHFEHAFDIEYAKKTSDEFIKSYVIGDYSGISKDDQLFFFNFRPDRMRQITRAFADRVFICFERAKFPKVGLASLTTYDKRQRHIKPAFTQEIPQQTLAQTLSLYKLRTLKIAESTKYAHVTYYFNGGVERAPRGESRILIESKDVENFAACPQMRVMEIAAAAEKAIVKENFDFILINISNCDMVGHTGNFNAAVVALETVDRALEKIVTAAINIGYTCVVTADHGNVEDMRVRAGLSTTHTKNPVPFLITNKGIKLKKGDFGLEVFAPTVLEIMELAQPEIMTGESLIR